MRDRLWYDRRRIASRGSERLDLRALSSAQRNGPACESFARVAAVVISNVSHDATARLRIDGLTPAWSVSGRRDDHDAADVVSPGQGKLLVHRGAGWSTADDRDAVLTIANPSDHVVEYCVAVLGAGDGPCRLGDSTEREPCRCDRE